MNIKDLEHLIGVLKGSDITELELDQDGSHIKLTRGQLHAPRGIHPGSQPVVEHAIVGALNGQAIPSSAGVVAPAPVAIDMGRFTKVESPIVGTFYRKPAPDSDPFVKEGDTIKKGETLCIIEAMKLMNEIESPCSGKVEKILLPDGKVVEYGEVLFLIDPSA